MRKKKNEIVIDLSKISPNLLIGLIVVLSFIAGFLFGRLTGGFGGKQEAKKQETKQEQQNVGGKKLSSIIKLLKIDEKKFKSCLAAGKYKDKIQSQFNEGAKAGVRGTPGGVIYDLKTGKMQNLRGAVPESELERMLADLKKGKSDPTAPKVEKPSVKKDHWRGPENARFVLIEYSDFQCPFCNRFHKTAEEFVKKHKDVAWVYRHFPLRTIHPYAQKLAEAAECVAEQIKNSGFWKFADKVFSAMPGLSVDY